MLAEKAKKRQGARTDLTVNIQPSEGGKFKQQETRYILAHNCHVSKNTIDKTAFIKQDADEETLNPVDSESTGYGAIFIVKINSIADYADEAVKQRVHSSEPN